VLICAFLFTNRRRALVRSATYACNKRDVTRRDASPMLPKKEMCLSETCLLCFQKRRRVSYASYKGDTS
jgi:hypothetical protein